ncbi:hypothetical protein [Xenorhabdus hominickii]|uniref:DUF7823 domain-containing protein n=1 Tax=Xenorhabdus hominickii TaxID=351679 RepID=A0A2G0QB40_XENHO|nr:hypothetical protein [Xenorhabdus hominickii]AOM40632.1 hypothetical protein A9255_08540 [Xenorhabdus hominickii]PHM56426.1 hypothetical protein Xhom_01915 [Xenorhabdus hominickii]
MSNFNKPVNAFPSSMLVVDVTLGIGHDILNDGAFTNTYWGYFSEEGAVFEAEESNLMPASGALAVIKNTTDISRTVVFYWIDSLDDSMPIFIWNAHSYKNDKSYNRLQALFEKDLYITVDGVTYALGKKSPDFGNALGDYKVINWYKNNAEAQKLGYILKQTGVTKRLQINWK